MLIYDIFVERDMNEVQKRPFAFREIQWIFKNEAHSIRLMNINYIDRLPTLLPSSQGFVHNIYLTNDCHKYLHVNY